MFFTSHFTTSFCVLTKLWFFKNSVYQLFLLVTLVKKNNKKVELAKEEHCSGCMPEIILSTCIVAALFRSQRGSLATE